MNENRLWRNLQGTYYSELGITLAMVSRVENTIQFYRDKQNDKIKKKKMHKQQSRLIKGRIK